MRTLRSLALLGLTCWATTASHAQHASNMVGELQLKPARTLYWRVGYTQLKPNNRNGNAKETGPRVIKYGDESTPGLDPQYGGALNLLSNAIQQDHPTAPQGRGLGIPDGVTVEAQSAGGFTITMGRYLDEDRHWAIEAYVLGQPFDVPVRGAGRIGGQGPDAVNLGQVMSTKGFGPIAYAKYIAGHKNDWIRPSIGFGGYYFVFFDTKASRSLADYSGGPTTIHVKNAYGPALFMGVDLNVGDGWTLNATLGYLKLETTAKAVTRSEPALLANGPAVLQSAKDVGPNTLTAIQIIDGTKFPGSPNLLPGIADQLAAARSGPGQAPSLGTYTRSFDARLDPWLLTVSVGRDF
jgi:outer membrane protein W